MDAMGDVTLFSMVVLATSILALGAYRSAVPLPLLAGEDSTVHLGAREALAFPVAASIVLLVMYFFFQSLQLIYICLSIVAAGVSCFLCLQPLVSLPFRGRVCGHDASTAVCALVALAITATWVATDHWLLLDLLGGSMCVTMLSVVKVPTVRVALLLYAGLLVYDVFWVFYSHHIFARNVMMEVAQSNAANPMQAAANTLSLRMLLPRLSLPAKLVIPALRSGAHSAMLGLGDVFVPGLLVAQCLRLDRGPLRDVSLGLWTKASGSGGGAGISICSGSGRAGPLHLFAASLVGYMVGLSVAIAVSLSFDAAQPALLYILPCVVLFPLLRAYSLRRAAAWLTTSTDDSAGGAGRA